MLGLNHLAWIGIVTWIFVPLLALLTTVLLWRTSRAVPRKRLALAVGLAILCAPSLISNGIKAYDDRQVWESCAKDRGVLVYEMVRLTPDLLDKAGRIRIPLKKWAKPSDQYYYESEDRYLHAIRDSAEYPFAVQARDVVTAQPLTNAGSSSIASQAQLDIHDPEWRFAA